MLSLIFFVFAGVYVHACECLVPKIFSSEMWDVHLPRKRIHGSRMVTWLQKPLVASTSALFSIPDFCRLEGKKRHFSVSKSASLGLETFTCNADHIHGTKLAHSAGSFYT